MGGKLDKEEVRLQKLDFGDVGDESGVEQFVGIHAPGFELEVLVVCEQVGGRLCDQHGRALHALIQVNRLT